MFSQDFLKNFPERLRSLRMTTGISQVDLGKDIGASKQSIANLENGHRTPGLDLFISIADYFVVSLDYLAGRSDKKEIR